MDKIQEFLLNAAATINTYLSNYILLILLIGVGVFYSIKTKFIGISVVMYCVRFFVLLFSIHFRNNGYLAPAPTISVYDAVGNRLGNGGFYVVDFRNTWS